MQITNNDRILFTGDSITDCNRVRSNTNHLGFGYVAFIAARLQARMASPDLQILNRGISGNRIGDLLLRVEPDLLDLQPTVISILLGINDTWRRYDHNLPTSTETFEDGYRTLLKKIRQRLTAKVILLEPFLLHVPEDRYAWREDLNPKIDVVRKLAAEFDTDLLPLDGLFAQAATRAPAAFWAEDGVHPTEAGHALIANAWLDHVGMA